MRCSGPDESLCNFGVCKPGLKPKQSCEFGHWERNFRSVFFLGKYVKMVSICFNKGHPRIWNTAPTICICKRISHSLCHVDFLLQELTQANDDLVLRLDGLREEFTRIHTKLHLATTHSSGKENMNQRFERRYWSLLVDFYVYVFCILETYQGKMSTWQLAVNYTSARPGLWHTSRTLRSKGKMCSKLWINGSQLLMLITHSKLSERFVQVELEQHLLESQDWKQKVSNVLK